MNLYLYWYFVSLLGLLVLELERVLGDKVGLLATTLPPVFGVPFGDDPI